MSLLSPAWDAEFADSNLHGVIAQQARVQTALRRCKYYRIAIDVGAHIGIWTTLLAAQFRLVHAFEPVRENMYCLECNTISLDNVVLWPQALGKDSGYIRMVRHGDNSGCWRVSGGADVELCRLDDYKFDSVDLLKIDVEGYEGFVLAGAEATLNKYKPVVVIENNGLGEKFYESEWVDPKVELKKHGYRMRARLSKDEIWTC